MAFFEKKQIIWYNIIGGRVWQILIFGRGYVYSIQYHMVWCVKSRHKVLVTDIERDLKEILRSIA